jgi:hypothetical protein
MVNFNTILNIVEWTFKRDFDMSILVHFNMLSLNCKFFCRYVVL